MIYLLDQGEVEVSVGSRVIGTLRGGSIFGGWVAMAILPEQPATIHSITPTRCYIIRRSALQKLWTNFPEIQLALVDYLQEQWRLFNWVEWLHHIPLFQLCEEEVLSDIELMLDIRLFQEGDVAFQSTSPCESLCILLRGRASVELVTNHSSQDSSDVRCTLRP